MERKTSSSSEPSAQGPEADAWTLLGSGSGAGCPGPGAGSFLPLSRAQGSLAFSRLTCLPPYPPTCQLPGPGPRASQPYRPVSGAVGNGIRGEATSRPLRRSSGIFSCEEMK